MTLETTALQEEDPTRYRKGGFHPVRLGDIYHGRYTVIRKLGFGMYSTIWLALDMRSSSYVVLKVLEAQRINGLEEITFMKTMNGSSETCPYIVKLLDTFEHQGPNGTHPCLIFEPLGESLWHFSKVQRQLGKPPSLPTWAAKRVAFQILTALKHLHGLGIIHTDLMTSNVLFTLPDANEFIRTELESDSHVDAILHQNMEEPYHPLPSRPLLIRPSKNFNVKLIDLGNAQMIGKIPDLYPIQPEALRAPEVILRAGWNESADIWNFACMIYELYSDYLLFDINDGPTYSKTDLHLALMQGIRGKFPQNLLSEGEYSDRYFSKDGTVSRVAVEPANLKDIVSSWLLELHGAIPKEIEEFYDFMDSALKLNPTDRPSAQQLLMHAWLSSEGK